MFALASSRTGKRLTVLAVNLSPIEVPASSGWLSEGTGSLGQQAAGVAQQGQGASLTLSRDKLDMPAQAYTRLLMLPPQSAKTRATATRAFNNLPKMFMICALANAIDPMQPPRFCHISATMIRQNGCNKSKPPTSKFPVTA